MAKTIFITGISAAGKSTLGERLEKDLLKRGLKNIKLLDGENIREELKKRGKHYGYTVEDRTAVVLEYAQMALDLNKKGINCILCTIAHIKEVRQEMRSLIGEVMEVRLDCPVDVCAKRDYKGQYVEAFKGSLDNFIGVTEPYQTSDSVDLILHTGRNSIESCSTLLLQSAMEFFDG